ncbi:hypothetical protein R5R35_006248 [Gryllus longicercus]|uniref:Glucose-methanol-choline oxidoreductase N-terminal domain-containing protein n=1 Tax=Gryllus longicercus TaxID=2509291 RepID=A0AAN9WVQ1_9ORTH
MAPQTCACTFQDTPFLANTCGATFTLFMALVESVLRGRCDVADPCHRLGRNDLHLDGKEFDFVVVGAGVAGPVVASRLSENPNWSVLLLEAGPEEPTATEVPAFATSAKSTPLDWNYTTVAQQNACLNKGGVCNWPRGKMVSGTGSMHGMMYTRGHPSIYDGWAELGNVGWGFEDVLPYFIKAENNGNPFEVDQGYHGFAGPLSVQHFPYHPKLAEAVVAAGEELGYRRGDLNGKNQTGINIAQMMQKNGLRDSTPRAYLRPLVGRTNIKLATESQVTRVLIDAGHSRARGVQFVDRNGDTKVVYARKEVILSAGAVGSPQLLLLSGVGPSEDLEALGIEVMQDLPVGRNLRNHVGVSVGFYIDDSSTESLTVETFNQFLNSRSGPMSSTGLTQTTAFLLSKYATDGVPDLQVFFDGYNSKCSRTGLTAECTSGAISGLNGVVCGRRYINARPTNIRPLSVGVLRLNSSNPFDHPVIDPRYLTAQRDVDVLVEGIKYMINFTQTRALRPYNFTLNPVPVAGCQALDFPSDEYWACVVRRATGPENHQVGSCRMGPAGDAHAVVDPQLRVHGLSGLRVIDASVFPWTPNSNPVAAIIMAAEKGADMIKAAWTPSGHYPHSHSHSHSHKRLRR